VNWVEAAASSSTPRRRVERGEKETHGEETVNDERRTASSCARQPGAR
jgi:hypothetical protein